MGDVQIREAGDFCAACGLVGHLEGSCRFKSELGFVALNLDDSIQVKAASRPPTRTAASQNVPRG